VEDLELVSEQIVYRAKRATYLLRELNATITEGAAPMSGKDREHYFEIIRDRDAGDHVMDDLVSLHDRLLADDPGGVAESEGESAIAASVVEEDAAFIQMLRDDYKKRHES
jgi:hypothetical protein